MVKSLIPEVPSPAPPASSGSSGGTGWRAHRYEIARDVAIAVAILAATIVFGKSPVRVCGTSRNLRFVRQTVIDGQSIKPFKGLDLADTNLAGFPMQCTTMGSNDTNIGCSDFEGADLSGADLSDSNLTGANLMFADLSNADLTGAMLQDANLRGAELGGTDSAEADITLVDFAETNWREATLENVCREAGYEIGPQPTSSAETCQKVRSPGRKSAFPNRPRDAPGSTGAGVSSAAYLAHSAAAGRGRSAARHLLSTSRLGGRACPSGSPRCTPNLGCL